MVEFDPLRPDAVHDSRAQQQLDIVQVTVGEIDEVMSRVGECSFLRSW